MHAWSIETKNEVFPIFYYYMILLYIIFYLILKRWFQFEMFEPSSIINRCRYVIDALME